MSDLFGRKTNGHAYLAPIDDPFRFIVAQFAQGGATQAIIKANKCGLNTYYPVRYNRLGEIKPLWSNYLFIEFREFTTIDLCRNTPYFLRILSARDVNSDLLLPIMVRRDAINESLKLIMQGKFDTKVPQRPVHVKGSMVLVREGSFNGRKVRLEIDVTPTMRGNVRVPVSIDGIRAVIEVHKLAL